MELDSTKLLILGGALVLLVIFWLVWKFFFSMVKHLIILVLLGGIFAGVYWYRSLPPPKNPAFGKHAYLTDSGKYLGIVEGEGEDPRRGAVWNIRLPGGYPLMYGKSRVTLKDKRDLASEPKSEPTSSPTPPPAAKTKPATPKK